MFAISQCGKLKNDIWVSVFKTILIISNAASDIYDSEREITNVGGREGEKWFHSKLSLKLLRF